MNTCPKCNSEYKIGETECQKCGIIFEKYEALQKAQIEKKQSLLMKCRVCDKEISKNAATCPHCGETNKIEDTISISSPVKKQLPTFIRFFRAGFLGGVVFFGLLIIFLLALSATKNFRNNTASTVAAPSAISIDPNTLFSDYESNEVRADELYKGKNLTVSGYIIDIAKDIQGEMYILLKTKSRIYSIQCYFDKRYTKILSSLKNGEFVTVTGRCKGKFVNVLLEDCALK